MTRQAVSNSKPCLPHGVRQATAADRTSLSSPIDSAFSTEPFPDGSGSDEDHLAAMMRKGEFLLAEDASGQLLGCIYTEIRDSRAYLGRVFARVRGESRNARGYLDRHVVDPESRGAGIGRLLIEAAEDYLRFQGCDAIDLTVPSLRTDLLSIYRRFGYVQNGAQALPSTQPLKLGIDRRFLVLSKEL